MTGRGTPLSGFDVAEHFIATPRFSAALCLTIVGAELCSLLVRELVGWPGLAAILAVLVLLSTLSLLARRHQIDWHGPLPLSVLIFVGWASISIFWSQYQWATFGSIVYFLAVTMLGVYIALVRDTIQIARAFGDVLRFVLAVSLGLEIFSGVLIDSPLGFLHIQGRLGDLGPIQGIFGTRNELAIVLLVAIITFAIELRTRSVERGISVGSLIVAGAMLLLSRSPIGIGTLLVVTLAGGALYLIRKLPPSRQRFGQITLSAIALGVAITAWVLRQQLIGAFSASSEMNTRLQLWRSMRVLIPQHNLEGWGWVGLWRTDLTPFIFLPHSASQTPASGLNAYLDVWFQLGVVGLLLFVGVLGLAFVRSWLLAASRRSIVYAWPALVLVALLVTSLAESAVLIEFGWLTFVVCSVKAARELSWRRAFTPEPAAPSLR